MIETFEVSLRPLGAAVDSSETRETRRNTLLAADLVAACTFTGETYGVVAEVIAGVIAGI
jgi:hypothetical protein